MNQTIKDFKEAVVQATKETTKGYDTSAQIVRVEGNTAWVHIPGGVDETPVKLTVNANEGDTVQVRVSGGSAWITGNATSPPTDDARAIQADNTATNAQMIADNAMRNAEVAASSAASAKSSAETAKTYALQAKQTTDEINAYAVTAGKTVTQILNDGETAGAAAHQAQISATNASEYASRALGNLSTVQSVAETLTYITQHGTMTLTTDVALDPTHVYFVQDAGGDYEVGGTYYAIVTEPDVADIATYYELTIDESLQNYVGTHLALTSEGLWLLPATSGTNKVLIATGAGSTYTIAGTYLIDSTGGTVASFRADGATMSSSGVQIAHLGYGAGTDGGGGTTNAPFYTIGARTGLIGNYSMAEGYNTEASMYASHAEGANTVSSGTASHAEGFGTTASGPEAHAEGTYTEATGKYCHAEGYYTDATGDYSHAEGSFTTASGENAHAEGYSTHATGKNAHAQNNGTIAASADQTALGKFNVADSSGTYAVIVGNGANTNNRANIMTVDWNGGVDAKGDVNIASGKHYKVNGSNLAAADVGAVPTTRKVNNKALSTDITLSASDVSALPISGGTVTGSLAIDNHSSAIGTVKAAYASAKSVATGTNTNLTSISLEAGTWVITGGVRFPNNATGYRRMNIATSSAASWADVQLPALSGASTQLAYTVIVSPTSTKTYYLNCFHNAGTPLSLVAGSASSENGINFLRAVRIA